MTISIVKKVQKKSQITYFDLIGVNYTWKKVVGH